jgi:hypothetical protein
MDGKNNLTCNASSVTRRYMYNKLFTKILDSSIWLEPLATRVVWLTFIAAMDEDGFVAFASPANAARRANVTLPEADEAIKVLEGPDSNSSDSANDGRRIERVPGGWVVLNAGKYRELVTREVAKQKTRERVAKFRAKSQCNADVTPCNASVTPSETYTETGSEKEKTGGKPPEPPASSRFVKPSMDQLKLAMSKAGLPDSEAEKFWNYYESNGWRVGRNPMRSWQHTVGTWKSRYEERRNAGPSGNPNLDRNKGTLNEGMSAQYRGVGRVV